MLLKEAGNLPVAIVRPSIGEYSETWKIAKPLYNFSFPLD